MSILKLVSPRVRKDWTWLLVLGLSMFFLLWTRVNYNNVEYGVWQSDEFHTVTQGVHNLLLKNKRINFRAQEGVRWMVRGCYPYALYKLCQQMGADPRRDSWGSPGHHWVQSAFGTFDPVNKNDPDMKLFLHALRVPNLLLFFLSFLPLLYYCYRKNYLLLAFGIVIAIGISDDILSEQRFFYIEPVLIVAINLLIAFFLYLLETGGKTAWLVVPAAFLSAWAVSVKLTGLFFAALPLAAWFWTARGNWRRFFGIVVGFSLLCGVFYLLINVTMFLSSVDDFIHDFFSNIWNYAAAGRVGRGLPHFRLIFAQIEGVIGAAAFLIPIFLAFGIWLGNRVERIVLATIAVLTLVSIKALTDTTMYMSRNIIPFYVPILVVVYLSLEVLNRNAVKRFPLFRKRGPSLALSLGLLFFPIGSALLLPPGPVQRIRSIYRRPKPEFLKGLEAYHRARPESRLYAIGFSESDFRGSSVAGNITFLPNAPEVLGGDNFASYVASLQDEFGPGFSGYVAVNRVRNNFELTNVILPELFAANDEWGEFFIFRDFLPPAPTPQAK